jgi:outer membrane lipoprotein-sorting protein
MNILRRLPLSRLLLLCGLTIALGVGATALALALGTGPTPPRKPLAQAIHDALGATEPNGVSASIQLTNHLLEGANLASGGDEASQLSSSPLISGAAGRLWVGEDGKARLELQSEKGDTQILWDGKTAQMYDASSNTLYRYAPPPASSASDQRTEGWTSYGPLSSPSGADRGASGEPLASTTDHKVLSVAEIEERLAKARKHLDISEAMPTDVAGQAAYTVRISPRENGGLIAGVELSWDAVHGDPLRAAIYSTNSAAPVIELTATEISSGQPESSALQFTPPANAKAKNVELPEGKGEKTGSSSQDKPHVTTHGSGLDTIVLAESPVKSDSQSLTSQLEDLQQVDINGTKASELPTQLGTLLSFERAGMRYLLVGSVTPSAIEAFARSL